MNLEGILSTHVYTPHTHTQYFHMVGHHTMRIITGKAIHDAKREIHMEIHTDTHGNMLAHIFSNGITMKLHAKRWLLAIHKTTVP